MWQPIKLTLENFRSFKECIYDFKKGAYLVQGVNNYDEGASSNGSGKSSLREALCFVLGLPTFSETNSDLVNNNAKKAVVTFELHNGMYGTKLNITRELPLKGSAKLTIEEDGKDLKDQFATVRDGDNLIINLIGISKEDLLNHYIISKEKFTSFFKSSDTKVKELISRFSNFDRIDGVEDYISEDIEILETTINTQETEKSKLEGKLELLNEELEKEKNLDVEKVKSEQIIQIEAEILGCEQNIELNKSKIKIQERKLEEANTEISDLKTEIKAIEESLAAFKEVNYDEEIEAVKTSKNETLELKEGLDKEVTELETKLKEYNTFKLQVETAIEGAIKCPKCLHEFIPNQEIDIEEAKLTLPTVLKEIKDFEDKIKENNEGLSQIQDILKEFNENLSGYEQKISDFTNGKLELQQKISNKNILISGKQQSIVNINFKIKKINDSIDRYKREIGDFNQAIEDIKKKTIETREKELKIQIEAAEKEMQFIQYGIHKINDERFSKNQWVQRFKKFRSKLANESLSVIEGYANLHLQKMKTNLNVRLEGYKQNKNGDVREKITPIVLRDGSQEGTGNFKKYSGGERGKIDIATSVLAIQELINNSCSTGGLNLVWLDEVTESIDTLGLESIVSSLSDTDKYFMVTSHVNHSSVHENIVTIEKDSTGYSKIL